MGVVLLRVDERLIHGQVVVGWSGLRPNRMVVVDDELAGSAWEQELYSLGLPSDVETRFLRVDEARDLIAGWLGNDERVVVLTRDVASMRRLAEGGLLTGSEVNIGGIHHAAGREQVLPYVYLSEHDRAELRRLAAEGVTIMARDLPHARRVRLEELMDGSGAQQGET